ncbi:MAG: hypothetical protein RR880_02970 [Bacteroidales bacterium]
MVNRIRNITYSVYILIIFFLLLGCNKDIDRVSSEEYTYINMSLTRSSSPDENLYNLNESRIRRVRVYIFEGERLEATLYTSFPDGENGTANILGFPGVEIGFTPVKVRVGVKNVYAVINEPQNQTAQNLLNNISSPEDLNSLQYELLKFVSFGDKNNYCLPMFAEQTKIRVTHSSESAPISLKLQAKRVLARVDIYLRKQSDIIYYIGLTPDSYLDIINSGLYGFYSPLIVPNNQLSNFYYAFSFNSKEINSSQQLLCSFYTPERDCSALSDKLKFSITNINNNGTIKEYTATIGADNSNINGVQNQTLNKIERNTIYQIKCVFSRTTFYIESINASIKDWEYGGELE